jgi:hypothetical protein
MAEKINAFERLRRTIQDNIKRGFIDADLKTELYMYLDRTFWKYIFRLKHVRKVS